MIKIKSVRPIFKKIFKILGIVVSIELVTATLLLIFFRIYTPTHYMSDEDALSYIVHMTEDERSNYITRQPNVEGDRLIRLWIAYKGAILEKTSSFDNLNPNIETYQLTDGSGYVEIVDGEYHVYDNNGNEIDPASIADEEGVIRMDL